MPEFKFQHSGNRGVPQKHGVTAKDEADAFAKMHRYCKKEGVTYVKGSMIVYQVPNWHKVPDPIRQHA